ncbi:hypothetical protein H5410_003288 [Solanum commersonii]|uniref:Gag-pol polyprotein n=1 Tax=Solanum commersonii TaxID=4109 RepID=A0A9J6B4M6_SOLCO|nr:hypothetical protein H5410_003288 [Solanum commersonii]
MATRRAYAGTNVGENANLEALPQAPINPLTEQVTNAQFRAAFHVLAQAVTAKANWEVAILVNPNVGTTASKVRDFTRLNPLDFYGSKVEEDPEEFIYAVCKVLMIMGVMPVEKVELVGYNLKVLLKFGSTNGRFRSSRLGEI